MRLAWCALLVAALLPAAAGCGPGRGVGRRRGPRKLTPLVFKQHEPNVPENVNAASGPADDKIGRNDSRFKDLVPNYNNDIIYRDEEGTGADLLMTQRCKEKVNTLAISVMNQWPGVKLMITEAWDEEYMQHSPKSLHYAGRAVDITTSDRDHSKYGMLARLAVEAGFDWVYYEARSHIHCSVKSESSTSGKYGGCFPGASTVLTAAGVRLPLSALRVGDRILAVDAAGRRVFSPVQLFLDYDPHAVRDFVEVRTERGRTLTATAAHLVLTPAGARYAGRLRAGDRLLGDRVRAVREVRRRGVFAPLTAAGTLVVDGVPASCYAAVDSHRLAHWAFAPARLAANARGGAGRLWAVASRPLAGWARRRAPPPAMGVHWYARALYGVAQYLMPGRLYA